MPEGTHQTHADRDGSTPTAPKRALDPSGSTKKADRSKRIRVSRACDQCRAGREKCDGSQPACHTCEAQDRQCTYNEQPKKRGIQPNYIRTLELTLAWLFQQFPESEDRLSQRLPLADDEAHRLIAFKDASASDGLHHVWRNGIVCKQIDQLLSGVDIELPIRGPVENSRPNGGDIPYNSPPLSAPSDASTFHTERPERVSSLPNRAQDSLQSTTGNAASSMTDDDMLRLPQNAWNLLEHYFAFTQTWLPITEKHDILRLMYTYPAQGLRRTEISAPEHAELWAIIAWSALQIGADDSDPVFNMCIEVAQSLVPKRDGFHPGHCKALLVLGLIAIAQRSWPAAWLTVGAAARLLIYFAAGKPLEACLSTGRAKHTFLAAFLIEKFISTKIGATAHLRSEIVQDIGLLVEDGIEEWSPWSDPTSGSSSMESKSPARSISTFNELVRVALRHEESAHSETAFDVIFALLNNSSHNGGRINPSVLLVKSISTGVHLSVSNSQRPTESSSSALFHARTNSTHVDSWEAPAQGQQPTFPDQHYPFMSIPNEAAESLAGTTPGKATVTGATPNIWPNEFSQFESHDAFGLPGHSALPGSDIFEELAILDHTETQNPKFMQNLGFGPDLDLAEFFGEDYQPSDPLLAYAQPGGFPDLSQPFDDNGTSAG